VLAALAVDEGGRLNVAWLDLSNTKGWQGPVAFGNAVFPPGAPVAMARQSDTVLAALAVDEGGRLNVVWLDQTPGDHPGIEEYVTAKFVPPTIANQRVFLATFFNTVCVYGRHRPPLVLAALAVDRDGAMNVVWLDLSNDKGWQGPVAFGGTVFAAGAHVAMFRQSAKVLAALAVSRGGAMSVAWLDLSNDRGWQGPVAFGDAVFPPGAPVAMFRQSGEVLAGLAVDRDGAMNVVWLDLSNDKGWQGPVAFGDAVFPPGAPIAMFRQSGRVLAALAVDRHGAMNVVWLDLSNNEDWQGPVAFGDAVFPPGAPVAMFRQSGRVLVALAVDRHGVMNVVRLDLHDNLGWRGPAAFGNAVLPAGAPVAMFVQSGLLPKDLAR